MSQHDNNTGCVTHSNVKERHVNNRHYFHVHVKTVVSGRKIESQKYFTVDQDSRSVALVKANAKATHLCHRHNQLRTARGTRVSLTGLFFNKDGSLKAFKVSQRIKSGRRHIELIAQKTVDKKQRKMSRTLNINDPELTTFNQRFNEVFKWFCESLKLNNSNIHVVFLKAIIKSTLAEKYSALTNEPSR
ncbi:MAG: hypothetical protein GY787_19225 [Alteromonadales bacterium]|nr:hypothetical protein [Alteromonadales bacterium]